MVHEGNWNKKGMFQRNNVSLSKESNHRFRLNGAKNIVPNFSEFKGVFLGV